MRSFNQLVIDNTLSGITPLVTPSEYDELLGRADELIVEVEVEASAGSSPTITVDVYHSNSGRQFLAATSSTIIDDESIASPPFRKIVAYNGGLLAALVQLRVVLGGTTPGARVRVWVCGRTH